MKSTLGAAAFGGVRPLGPAIPAVSLPQGVSARGIVTWTNTGITHAFTLMLVYYSLKVGGWRTLAMKTTAERPPGTMTDTVEGGGYPIYEDEVLGDTQIRLSILDPDTGYELDYSEGTLTVTSGVAAVIVSVSVEQV